MTDERRARAVADLIVESFEPAEAASTAFETEDAWPGGGKAWLVEAYFGVAAGRGRHPGADRRRRRRSDRRGRDLRAHGKARLGRQRPGRPRPRARRTLPRPRRARPRQGQAPRHRRRDRGRPRLRHRPPRHDARLPPPLRPAPEAPPPRAGCSTSAAARACSPSPPPRFCDGKCSSATSTPSPSRSPTTTPASTASANSARPSSRAAWRAAPCGRTRPTTWCSPTFWRSRCACSPPRSPPSPRPDGDAIVSGLLFADVPGVLAAWRAQGFHLAERIDLEGWASLRLRRR